MHGHTTFVEQVLKLSPWLARSSDSQTSSPLHIAADEGDLEITKRLVLVAPETCWWRDDQGMNPVHIAAVKGHFMVLAELLRLDLFPARERVHRGQTVCVKHCQIETLKVLVEKLGDLVYAKDDDGETLLHLAVRSNQLEATVSPPGGVWQDDTSSHNAGEAAMATTHPKAYKLMFHYTSIYDYLFECFNAFLSWYQSKF
ncbi:ankyrin repeat-containing protein BDA1-like [Salvia splendens]|uniref:ankyrin repeat-containing protein BDA1-like n=1 Tax=Salvia splendens TaxID=180675 RepID=UPI001C25E575|nr:ankyrin repeat-containing protein BDA1-like [Salvia splendens]